LSDVKITINNNLSEKPNIIDNENPTQSDIYVDETEVGTNEAE
jgi:hypothetical protein